MDITLLIQDKWYWNKKTKQVCQYMGTSLSKRYYKFQRKNSPFIDRFYDKNEVQVFIYELTDKLLAKEL